MCSWLAKAIQASSAWPLAIICRATIFFWLAGICHSGCFFFISTDSRAVPSNLCPRNGLSLVDMMVSQISSGVCVLVPRSQRSTLYGTLSILSCLLYVALVIKPLYVLFSILALQFERTYVVQFISRVSTATRAKTLLLSPYGVHIFVR